MIVTAVAVRHMYAGKGVLTLENSLFITNHLPKLYFRFALPVVFSMVVTMVYNLVDTYFIAATGNTDLVAGVSLCAPVFTFLMAIGNIFAQGGCTLTSRLLGHQDTTSVRHVSAFCVYAALASGAGIGICMFLFRAPLLHMLGAGADTLPYAMPYYTWMAAGAPLVVVSFIYTNLLRAVGKSKEAMIGNISGAILNMLLDPFFIFTLKLGSGGAAIATVLGYLFSTIYCFVIFAKKDNDLSIHISEAGVSGAYVKQIFGIGIPAALTNIMTSLSVAVMNIFLLPYGTEKVAAMGIVLKIHSIVLLILTGLAFGGQPLYGYYFGSGDRERLTKLFRFCITFISASAVALSLFVYMASTWLLGFFLDDPQLIATGTTMLHLQVISAVFIGFVLLSNIVIQSAGKIAASFILSVSRQGIIFLPVILIAAYTAGYYGILISQAIADVITAGIACMLLGTLSKQHSQEL